MPHNVERCRESGSLGGQKVARLYPQAFMEARAQKGGRATLMRYGREYYRAIVRMRWAKRSAA